MTLEDAETKALCLMWKHGLSEWKFAWDRKKKGFGWCSRNTKTICLSANLVKLNNEAEVTDTILHEISHALDWIRNGEWGHGPTWKKICVEVGCRPQQYFTEQNVVMETPKYVLMNNSTGRIAKKYYRLPTKGINPNYTLCNGSTGAIIKPTHILKNYVTDKVIERYYTLPEKIRDRQQYLFESGKPSTKGQLKLYKVL